MAGQVAFIKMAALELAQYAICVNAVCPGSMIPILGIIRTKAMPLRK